MPPEPLPWDRKEFRKHEGGGGFGGFGVTGGGSGPRWREPPFPPHYHHHPYSNNGHYHHGHNNHHHGGSVPPRWLPDFRYRPPPGHSKQAGRHLYIDDFGHGFMPSRNNDKMLDDESCRPPGPGRYGRNSRDNKGSLGQKDWKSHTSETSSLQSGPGRPNNTSDQRSVDNMPLYNSSHPCSESVNSRDQTQSKDQHDRNGAVGDIGNTGQKLEREDSLNSINWKPLKWPRSGSMSSRGSSFSHSSSSKSMVPDPNEMKTELVPNNITSVQSTSEDAAAGATRVTSVAPSEVTSSRKKPRLGWGEGLAKYEKKKVEGTDDSMMKSGANCNSEPSQSHASNLTDKSPRVVVFPDCVSPATPSSVACSSSPGLEEKQLLKGAVVDHDCAYVCSSPSILSQNQSDESTFTLENLDLTSMSHLNSSINELMQSDDPCSEESGLARPTAIDKLLLWKNDISKTLEATESEIDLLDNELKSLISGSKSNHQCLAASSSVPLDCVLKCSKDDSAASDVTLRPAALQIMADTVIAYKDDHVTLKDLEVDSPGSATSKFVEMSSSGKYGCPPDLLNDAEAVVDSNVSNSGNLEVECSVYGLNGENAVGLSSSEDGFQLFGRSLPSSSDATLQSGREEVSYELVLASNRNCARTTSEVFSKLLPTSECNFDISNVISVSCLENHSVRKRFFKKKHFLRLKERLITLKFKMYHHLWKEDTQLLSLKKSRAKSHKKFDLSLRNVNSGCQKHRSSIRNRYLFTAGLNLMPTMEMMNFASLLLLEPRMKPLRSVLKMPAMILDKQERIASMFISSNGLVEDPCAVEKAKSMFNPWTSEEKKIFIDKLAEIGKDFRKIAHFLDHKTTADCIEFYYKNHKSDSFERAKKKPDFTKQAKATATSTYLVPAGKLWSREANSVSLDILGAASAMAASIENGVQIRPKCTSRSFLTMSGGYRRPRCDDGLLEKSNSLGVYSNEKETLAADVLAGICGSLSSEAMSSCITTSVDPGEGYQERKYQIVGSSTRRPLTTEVTQNVDDETCSDESCEEMDPTDWTDEEKSRLIEAVSSYGRDFAMISRCVRSRSQDQCKVFFSKARKCLGLDMIFPGPGNITRDELNGGGSDMEDACVLKTGVTCSEKSFCKVEDFAPTDMKLKNNINLVGTTNRKPDLNRIKEDNEVGDMESTDTELMSRNSIPEEDCQMEDKPEMEFERDGDINNAAELISVQDQGNVHSNSDLYAKQDHSGLGIETHSGDVNAADVEDPTAKSEGQRLVIHEVENGALHLGGSMQGKHSEARLTGNSSQSAWLQRNTDLELIRARAKHRTECVPSDLKKTNEEHIVESLRTNEEHLSKSSLAEPLESSCILRGYAVPVSVVKEMGNDSCKKSIPFQGISQSDRTSSGHYSARDSYLQRCSNSRTARLGCKPELPSQEQLRDCYRISSESPDFNKPRSNGKVKLFGQILSKPSQHKPYPNTQRSESLDSKSSNMKYVSDQKFDEHSAPMKFDRNNFAGSENLPLSSDFLDGNRMQNGSSLPDSTKLLAKYPATALDNYAMPLSKLERQPLHGVGENVECSLNGVSIFLNRDLNGSKGLADFCSYKNQELQPFTIDVKQRHDILFSEMQKRNPFDVASGKQQHSRGVVGINTVEQGGVLVSGQCSGVSDPVAAIKIHYAKAEQFTEQARSISRDDDSWRGKGSIGR